MNNYVITYRLGGKRSTARVAGWDEKTARARFAQNNPKAAITGVRRA